jgi:hypothetical protein
MNEQYSESDSSAPLNPFHQERPLCGASIGAYIGHKHLPPVSYGGVVRVDGEPYGMTVHHLLDAPSDEDNSEYGEDEGDPERSSARRSDGDNPWLAGVAGHPTLQTVPTDSMFPLEISDDDEPSSEEEEYSDEEYVSSDEEYDNESVGTDDTGATEGDLKGIKPGSENDIVVTQPALDDVDEDFFPSEDDKDDDHLDSHRLGYVYASSGIRRWEREGIKHEVDWALLKLDENRLQPYNLVQGGKRHLSNPSFLGNRSPKLLEPVCRSAAYSPDDDEYPVRIAKSEELGNLRVHCFGRTSGLQGGTINQAMSSVRIYRRRTFSRSWNVVGTFGGMLTPFLPSSIQMLNTISSWRRFWRLGHRQRTRSRLRPRARLVRAQCHCIHLPNGSPPRGYQTHPSRVADLSSRRRGRRRCYRRCAALKPSSRQWSLDRREI